MLSREPPLIDDRLSPLAVPDFGTLLLPHTSAIGKSRHLASPDVREIRLKTERAGYGKAAVALANKNVPTAWAMLTQGTEYQRRPQLKVAV
jgi:hypothetical protein